MFNVGDTVFDLMAGREVKVVKVNHNEFSNTYTYMVSNKNGGTSYRTTYALNMVNK